MTSPEWRDSLDEWLTSVPDLPDREEEEMSIDPYCRDCAQITGGCAQHNNTTSVPSTVAPFYGSSVYDAVRRAVAEEREACALLAENTPNESGPGHYSDPFGRRIARLIRARVLVRAWRSVR